MERPNYSDCYTEGTLIEPYAGVKANREFRQKLVTTTIRRNSSLFRVEKKFFCGSLSCRLARFHVTRFNSTLELGGTLWWPLKPRLHANFSQVIHTPVSADFQKFEITFRVSRIKNIAEKAEKRRAYNNNSLEAKTLQRSESYQIFECVVSTLFQVRIPVYIISWANCQKICLFCRKIKQSRHWSSPNRSWYWLTEFLWGQIRS
jgi:hypothetical protein